MKTLEYNGHTITYQTGSHCVLLFLGVNLSPDQLNATPIKCFSGVTISDNTTGPIDAINKAKEFINKNRHGL